MKVLITGAKGFIGRNLVATLENIKEHDVLKFDTDTERELLDEYCRDADFVFHLAGVNRTGTPSEFMETNRDLTAFLLEKLKKHKNACPVMIASSIQASLDNPFGRSKKEAEELIISHGRETGAEVLIYRFPNVFGKWCRPNYNSLIATFCHNMANDLSISIDDPDLIMKLVYIDDLIEELVRALNGGKNGSGFYCDVPVVHFVKLGDVFNHLTAFREGRTKLTIPDMSKDFIKKLYTTYTSYLPQDQFGYHLKKNSDDRGSFTELIRTEGLGQISVNCIKPGIVKGNHWHHTKCEKFLAVSGKGVVRFREVGSAHVIEYKVAGDIPEVMDIPAGYTHNIENTGASDLIVIIWANEAFDPDRPDTYFMEV
ncbi:MAG: capsular biosynthesis protein [Bacillota bacterium]|nr:capsular biosynthesis protein [Bacillota bacterium]